jgi:DNA polymerase-3 subunit epsilon
MVVPTKAKPYYRKMISLKHKPLVFVDIETTGGRYTTSHILDIGIIRVENGVVVQKINQLVQPNAQIPYFITKLTGITNEMVWDQPQFQTLAPALETIFKDAVFIAHNVNFDYRFFKQEFKRVGITFNSDRMCTVKLSRRLHPEHRGHSLDRIIERMGLTVTHRHRGYDDAEVIWKFFMDEYKQLGPELFVEAQKVTTLAKKEKVDVNNQQTRLL